MASALSAELKQQAAIMAIEDGPRGYCSLNTMHLVSRLRGPAS